MPHARLWDEMSMKGAAFIKSGTKSALYNYIGSSFSKAGLDALVLL